MLDFLVAGIFYPLFGLVTYATYNLTNLATLEGWPILVTIVDVVWGTMLSASVALISMRAGKGRIWQSQLSAWKDALRVVGL